MRKAWNGLPDGAKLAIGAAAAYIAVMALIALFAGIHVLPMWLWGKPGASTAWTVTGLIVLAVASAWYYRRWRRSVRRTLRSTRSRLPAARAGLEPRRVRLASWASWRLRRSA